MLIREWKKLFESMSAIKLDHTVSAISAMRIACPKMVDELFGSEGAAKDLQDTIIEIRNKKLDGFTDSKIDCLRIDKKSAWGRAVEILEKETGLSIRDFPDGLPIEDFIDADGNLDYDGILNW